LFEKLFEETPASAEINFFVGRCALELRHYDEAIAAFDRVLILNPKHTRTHLELARLYFERQQLELAQTELDIVLNEQLPNDIRDVATAFKRQINERRNPHKIAGALIVGGGMTVTSTTILVSKSSHFHLLTFLSQAMKKRKMVMASQHLFLTIVMTLVNEEDGV